MTSPRRASRARSASASRRAALFLCALLAASVRAAAIPSAPGEGAPATARPPLDVPLFASLPPGKSLHFIAGMASGFLAAAAVEGLQNPHVAADYPLYLPSVALSTAAAAGLGKEVLDSTGFGGAEFSDILITSAGGLVASAAIAYAEGLFPATPEGRTNGATLFAATGALLAVPVIIGFIHEIERSIKRRTGR